MARTAAAAGVLSSWVRPADSEPRAQSLALTLVCYLCLAWTVVWIRELRHSLPFVVLVLPLAVGEIQRLVRES